MEEFELPETASPVPRKDKKEKKKKEKRKKKEKKEKKDLTPKLTPNQKSIQKMKGFMKTFLTSATKQKPAEKKAETLEIQAFHVPQTSKKSFLESIRAQSLPREEILSEIQKRYLKDQSKLISRKYRRMKLFQFYEDRRPPYWGPFVPTKKYLHPQNPFHPMEKFDYSYDSGNDFSSEDEGEKESFFNKVDLIDLEEEEELEGRKEGDVEDGWVVKDEEGEAARNQKMHSLTAKWIGVYSYEDGKVIDYQDREVGYVNNSHVLPMDVLKRFQKITIDYIEPLHVVQANAEMKRAEKRQQILEKEQKKREKAARKKSKSKKKKRATYDMEEDYEYVPRGRRRKGHDKEEYVPPPTLLQKRKNEDIPKVEEDEPVHMLAVVKKKKRNVKERYANSRQYQDSVPPVHDHKAGFSNSEIDNPSSLEGRVQQLEEIQTHQDAVITNLTKQIDGLIQRIEILEKSSSSTIP